MVLQVSPGTGTYVEEISGWEYEVRLSGAEGAIKILIPLIAPEI
jgi:hypothetical protein